MTNSSDTFLCFSSLLRIQKQLSLASILLMSISCRHHDYNLFHFFSEKQVPCGENFYSSPAFWITQTARIAQVYINFFRVRYSAISRKTFACGVLHLTNLSVWCVR